MRLDIEGTGRALAVAALGLGLVALAEAPARAAPDRLALLQADAFLMDARNEAKVVRESAERLARTKAPDEDASLSALVRAVGSFGSQMAAIRRGGNAPAGFDEASGAAADVERDLRAVRQSVTARDARGIREDADHVLQAIDRVDVVFDRVFATARIDRLSMLRRRDAGR